jgi:sulfite reductase (NADPH) flavoprotein alpha-component
MNPGDAAALGLEDDEPVEVRTRRGAARAELRIDPATPAGTVFLPIHWNDLWSAGASPNEATTDAADPLSRQPALKHCAAAVRSRRAAAATEALPNPLSNSEPEPVPGVSANGEVLPR